MIFSTNVFRGILTTTTRDAFFFGTVSPNSPRGPVQRSLYDINYPSRVIRQEEISERFERSATWPRGNRQKGLRLASGFRRKIRVFKECSGLRRI